jgi:hypothetical protein
MRPGPRLRTLVGLGLTHPVELVDRIVGQVEVRRVAADRAAAVGSYRVVDDWLEAVHRLCGADAAACDLAFAAAWERLERAVGGLVFRGHDADPAFARAVWCAVAHSSASRVVETGVGRGVSSRMILEASGAAGGRLWSVDLPLLAPAWSAVAGTAVTAEASSRWTYVRGSSRRRLPALLREVGPIDVFVQDSRSTFKTAAFELAEAWHALRPGGILVANGIHSSLAFARHCERERPTWAVVGALTAKDGLFGVAQKDLAQRQ